MAGTGARDFSARVDNILHGRVVPATVRQRVALAAACLMTIATVAACQQERSVLPLRENPDRDWVPEDCGAARPR